MVVPFVVILPHFFLLFYPFEVDCHLTDHQSVVVLKPRNIQRDEGKILCGKLLFFQCSQFCLTQSGGPVLKTPLLFGSKSRNLIVER